MVFSTPPFFTFPLSFVKSNTWLTVSTSDVPHAWTVCRKEAWLWSRLVSERSSAEARIYVRGKVMVSGKEWKGMRVDIRRIAVCEVHERYYE